MNRRIRVGLAAALAAALVAAVLIGYALISRSAPAAAPVAPPSSVPASSGSASTGPASTAPGGSGRISLDELARATVTLPAWPAGAIDGCPTGKFPFRGKDTELSNPLGTLRVSLAKTVYVDVDHDGADETAAWIICAIQGGTAQVVVFDRDAAGSIVTLGQVVGSGNGAIRNVNDIRADPGGAVGVQVADVGPIDGSDVFQYAQQQWRGYGWNGKAFSQTGGPTAFPANPYITDLVTTVTDLHLVSGPGGARQGSVTVTVRNNGKTKPAKMALSLTTGAALTLRPPAGLDCPLRSGTPEATHDYACTVATPAPGASVTYTFGFTAAAQLTGSQPDGEVIAGGLLANGEGMLDHPWENNSAKFHVLLG